MTTLPLPKIEVYGQSETEEQVSATSVSEKPVQQKASKKKLLSLVFRIVVTLLLFVFLFKSLSWTTLWMTLTHIHRAVALLGLTIGFCTLVVSAYQWQSLLRTERIAVDLTRLINLYVVGIAFNHFLPTSMGGDVVKAYYVGRDSGNTAGATSAVLMTRITGFFGMLLLALPALFIWHRHFSNQIVFWLLISSLLMLLIIGGAFGFAHFFPRIIQTTFIQSVLARLLPYRIREKLAHSGVFSKGMKIGHALNISIRRPGSMCVAILFGLLFHITASLNYYSYGLALRMDVPLYFYFVAIPLVSLIAFLPISVNGFGVRESALVYIFLTAHVPVATTLLLAFVMDVQMLFFGLCGICIYLFMGRRKRHEHSIAYPVGRLQPIPLE